MIEMSALPLHQQTVVLVVSFCPYLRNSSKMLKQRRVQASCPLYSFATHQREMSVDILQRDIKLSLSICCDFHKYVAIPFKKAVGGIGWDQNMIVRVFSFHWTNGYSFLSITISYIDKTPTVDMINPSSTSNFWVLKRVLNEEES